MAKTMNAINGKFLGYPECCIKAFGDIAMPMVFRPRVIRENTFNGFVPCGAHATQLQKGIIDREELIEEINLRRRCSVPFKVEHTIEEDTTINDELWALMAE